MSEAGSQHPSEPKPPAVTSDALLNADPGSLRRAASGMEQLRGKLIEYGNVFGDVLQPALESSDPDVRAAAAERAERMRRDALRDVEALDAMDQDVQRSLPGFSAPQALSRYLDKQKNLLRTVARGAAQAAGELTDRVPGQS